MRSPPTATVAWRDGRRGDCRCGRAGAGAPRTESALRSIRRCGARCSRLVADHQQADLGHVLDRELDALATEAGILDAAVGHVVDAPARHVVDDDAADL